jgi:hypothetical protein
MPEPVRPNTAQTATPPARRGPRRRRSSTPDRSNWARSHPPPEPSSRGHGTEGPCLGAASSHPGYLRGTGPRTGNPESSRSPQTEQPGIRRPRTGLPARQQRLATPAACPASTTSRPYDLRRTCRLVTGRSHLPRSTWPDHARLPLPTVTHRYKRTHRLRLEQFQIADYAAYIDGARTSRPAAQNVQFWAWSRREVTSWDCLRVGARS